MSAKLFIFKESSLVSFPHPPHYSLGYLRLHHLRSLPFMMDTALIKASAEASSSNAFDTNVFELPRQLPLSLSAGSVNNRVGMQL